MVIQNLIRLLKCRLKALQESTEMRANLVSIDSVEIESKLVSLGAIESLVAICIDPGTKKHPSLFHEPTSDLSGPCSQ